MIKDAENVIEDISNNNTPLYKYKFSIIMAVYKVEEYVSESIESILSQDIGFEEHVQLILVDDGSPDNSGTICDSYAAKYPNNIIVIHKENGGVSSTRNNGIEIAEGEFVNFIDSDDKFSKNTLSEVYKFFSQVKSKTHVVCVPLFFFEASSGPHPLNYKFKKGNCIINLLRIDDAILLSTSSAFYSSEIIKQNKYREDLDYSEDFELNYRIFLEYPTLGLVSNAKYLYRKRSNTTNSSAIQSRQYHTDDYINYLQKIPMDIMRTYEQEYKYIPRFVQSAIMYDLQWRIKQEHLPPNVLTDDEINVYIQLMSEVLQFIDNDIILRQKSIFVEYKIRALELKYKVPFNLEICNNDVCLYRRNMTIKWLSSTPLRINIIESINNCLEISGSMAIYAHFLNSEHEIVVKINETEYVAEKKTYRPASFSLDIPTVYHIDFVVRIPFNHISDYCEFNFYHIMDNNYIQKNNILFLNYVALSTHYKKQYLKLGDYILTYSKPKFILQKQGRLGFLRHEKEFLKELLKTKKTSDLKAFYIRIVYRLLKLFKRKKIWILSDRVNKAGDNGQAFFEYLQDEKPNGITTYFVISQDCPDYEKMKSMGKVIPYLSHKHKLLHLLSDVIISSAGENHVTNPFQNFSTPYKDILSNKPFIFLQHGVTKDNLSTWLNKFNKNIKGFVTAATPEHSSILEYDYYYENKNVWLTGFPRFDKLYSNERKIITIMPTWRKYLAQDFNSNTGIWNLSPDFIHSDFYKFYNQLINHPNLISTCNEYSYTIKFMPHPNLIRHVDLFKQTNNVDFETINANYTDIYAESNLVITDYSSAVFDFAYLRKPIIYAHFDYNEFFAGEHVYTKGYFDYEHDGFGEVCYDLESTVTTIIDYIKTDCTLKDNYRNRIDKFFAFNDKNNCKRVFEKIINLKNNNY